MAMGTVLHLALLLPSNNTVVTLGTTPDREDTLPRITLHLLISMPTDFLSRRA